ncbi:MAG TPA: hypothetical protein VN151_04475 [Terracidiphilus sp.]|nr:hypothetical protein [Terracidiphilus sp.]
MRAILTLKVIARLFIVPFLCSGMAAQRPQSTIASLIAKAKAAGTKEGARAYSEYLIEMLVPTQKVGNAFGGALSRRLATADFAAREGKRSWVPESFVARAFNDLMKQAADASGGPAGAPSRTIETNVSVVHQLRLRLYNGSPYLSSVDSHGSECLPSEALLIMQQLFLTDGAAPEPLRPGAVRLTSRNFPTADSLVSRYVVSHSRSETVKLYDNLAHNLGF